MEEEVKSHTRFVVGGIYSKNMSASSKIFTVMVGASLHMSGRRNGTLYSDTLAPILVQEDSQRLDEWTLVAEPVSVDLMRQIEVALLHRIEALEQKMAAYQAPPEVIGPKPPGVSETLVEISNRTTKRATGGR